MNRSLEKALQSNLNKLRCLYSFSMSSTTCRKFSSLHPLRDLTKDPNIQMTTSTTILDGFQCKKEVYDMYSSMVEYNLEKVLAGFPSNSPQQATVVTELGLLQQQEGYTEKALQSFFRALDILHSFPECTKEVSRVLSCISTVYFDRKDFSQALLYAQQTLQMREFFSGGEKEDLMLQIESNNNVGTLLSLKREYEEASGHFRKAWALIEECSDAVHEHTKILTLYNLGCALIHLGEERKGEERSEKERREEEGREGYEKLETALERAGELLGDHDPLTEKIRQTLSMPLRKRESLIHEIAEANQRRTMIQNKDAPLLSSPEEERREAQRREEEGREDTKERRGEEGRGDAK